MKPGGSGTTIAAVLLLVGGGAAGGFWAARSGSVAPSPAASALPQQQAELARLATQALASARPNEEGRAVPAPAPAPVADEPAAAPAPTPTPREEAAWIAARAKSYDEALAREPRNEAWAAPLERMLRAAYPASAAGTHLVNVECRTHVCRVEIETREGADRSEELMALGARIPELANASYAYPGEPDSHRQAILYLMRDGHLLPRLDYTTYAEHLPARAP